MPDGTATAMTRNEKTALAYMDWPDTNMWWPQTRKPITAIAIEEQATNQ